MTNTELLERFEEHYGVGYLHIKNTRRCASRWTMDSRWSLRNAARFDNFVKLARSPIQQVTRAFVSGLKEGLKR